MVLLSAVLASVVSRAGLGAEPTFEVPQYDLDSLGELPLFLGLGAAAGGVSLLFAAAASAAAKATGQLQRSGLPSFLLPPLGGLAAGGVALAYPETLYNGFDNVDAILAAPPGLFSPSLLLQIVGAKLAATALARACGLVGGFYAPSLFMGAALGAAYGAAAQTLPFAQQIGLASPAAYALLGMAATLAAVCRVPLTAILLLFEYTQDFRMLLPLMATVGVAAWVASVSDERALAAAAAAEAAEARAAPAAPSAPPPALAAPPPSAPEASDDPELAALLGRESRLSLLLRELPVSAAMRPSFLTLPADASLLHAARALVEADERCALLAAEDGLPLGLLTHEAAQRALGAEPAAAAAAAGGALLACARAGGAYSARAAAGRVHPDTSLAEALAVLNAGGLRLVPVVPRAADGGGARAVGVLALEAVGDAAQRELTLRAVARAGRALGRDAAGV